MDDSQACGCGALRAALAEAHLALDGAHNEITAEIDARERVETQLRQAQKLEAVGRLAAGVAHEINTPVQFVNDSLHFVREAVNDSLPLLAKLRELRQAALEVPALLAEATDTGALEDELDFDYLLTEMPKALSRALDGLGRIANIVRSLKEFAHPDQKTMSDLHLAQAIRSTLTIAAHEYKLVADVETELGDLPPLRCHAGEINQVLLNLIVNAAHAIGDRVAVTQQRGTITIRTRADGDWVVIEIADTGKGIPAEIQERVFDPFFTTKGVGKGTGQGLALARSVMEKHAGELSFVSTVDVGTTFTLRLPTSTSAVQTEGDAVRMTG